MKVLLDTNFLMLPHQFGVDIFEFLKDYELITLSSCVSELKKLSHGKGKDGLSARVALKLMKENNVHVIKTGVFGDASIVKYAVEEKCSVATNDIALIKALKNSNIKIIRLKQKKYLAEE
ncbi:MAG: PIN domain-containing protein [Candidatus Aenigmatarchaeota archaeon]